MISFCCIYDEGDRHHLTDMLSTIPAGHEVILMEIVPSKVEKPSYLQGTMKQEGLEIRNYIYEYDETKPSFADWRNEAKRHALGKIIFMIDADERLCLTQSEVDLLLSEPEQTADLVGGFIVTIINYELKNGQIISTQNEGVRAFRHFPLVNYVYRVHEDIVPSLEKLHYKIARTTILIKHLGYLTENPKVLLNKLDRNYYLGKQDLQEIVGATPWSAQVINNLLQTVEGYRKVAHNYFRT